MVPSVGVAEAKRRFSELLDRVAAGERIVVARHGRPAVVLVPPYEEHASGARPAPAGFASLAGALADWDDFEAVAGELHDVRRKARDRDAPPLD